MMVNSPNKASVPDNNKLALNPPETPEKAARPAIGCLPRAANKTAPKGVVK